MANAIPHIIDQHAEEAAFLWLLRDQAIGKPHYTLADLAMLDERVEAHLDGLRIAGDAGWDTCRKMLEEGEAGEAFTAGILAFESGQAERIQRLFELVGGDGERRRGMIAALAWLPWTVVEKQVRRLAAKDMTPVWRSAAIAAAALQRQNLGGVLEDALLAPDPLVKARAIEAAGELGQVAMLPHVRRNLTAADHGIRFASAWSAALLQANADAVAILRAFAQSQSPYGDQATLLAARRLAAGEMPRWRDRLLMEKHSCRRAVLATGAQGDPAGVPFLIDTMQSPGLARLAGDALCLITGLDLADQNLEAEPPDGFEAGPTEDADDDHVELDPDENLPWPAVAGISKWWQAHQGGFARGTRHILGKPISAEWLRQILRTGMQRQRNAAALELALLQPGRPLFPTAAPAKRQQMLLQA